VVRAAASAYGKGTAHPSRCDATTLLALPSNSTGCRRKATPM
jgi:hypothetical protein